MAEDLETSEGLVRIRIRLEGAAEGGPAEDAFWAEPLGSERYRVESCPFFAYGISRDDVVRAIAARGDADAPRLEDVMEKGGHRTLRMALDPDAELSHGPVQALLEKLLELGCTHEALRPKIVAIPAVKAVSFGEGFGFAGLHGSEANDAYAVNDSKIVTETNHNGGVLGGITTGMPVVFEVAVKPTASISVPQQTVNLTTMEPETITVRGRHDACIVPRAAAAVEAAACIALLDLMLERNM
jgi:hypothetical protein